MADMTQMQDQTQDQNQNNEFKLVHEKAPTAEVDEELKVESKIEYEEKKTIDDIINEADEIFESFKRDMKKFRKTNKLPMNYFHPLNETEQLMVNNEADRLLKYYQKKNEKFQQAYPLVLRFMIQTGKYNSSVFKLFMTKMTKNPYKSEDEYFDRYSEYAKMLHKHYNPRSSANELKYVYETTKISLKKEKETFESTVKKYENEYSDRMKKAQELKKKYILERIAQITEHVDVTNQSAVVDQSDDYVLVENE
jgi:hypothetical protein